MTLLDCQDIIIENVLINGAGFDGVRIGTVTNGSNQRLKLSNFKVRNPATTNTAANLYGVVIDNATDLTIDNLEVTCDNGFMVYGLFFEVGDQASFSLRNSSISGDTGVSVRLLAGPIALKDWSNNRLSGSVSNFPVAVPTRVGGHGVGTLYAANAIPTAGTYRVGDRCVNSAPTVGSPKSWVCTVAGTPGTWVSEGNL
jgi:hypothetical protein